MKRFAIALLLPLAICSFSLNASIKLYPDVKDLNQVVTQIAQEKVNRNKILVIFDIDDTLLESVNFISSVKWYNWQRGRAVFSNYGRPIKIRPEQKYNCIFSMLGTLFEMGSTVATQKDASQIIQQLAHYDLVYLTARTTIYRSPTERELINNNLSIDEHQLGENILHFMLDDGHRTAKVTYEKGIAMSSGLNKGKVLKALLKKLNKSYEVIYFVDDSQKNIDNMNQVWKDSKSLVHLFHYTRVSKNISQQEIATSDKAKAYFEQFIQTAFPERMQRLKKQQCH